MAAHTGAHEPVPPREAFQERSASARRSQAALLLSVGAAVGADPGRVPAVDELPLPRLEPLAHPAPIPLDRAAGKLAVDTGQYVSGWTTPIPDDEPARLTRELYEAPEVDTAASLVEAGMHSQTRLVRTAAAIAALDTTGPREDVVDRLEEAAGADDIDIRELGRTGLARARPDHPMLDRYTVRRRPHSAPRSTPSNTAVLSHGTWASRARWWRPGGVFYDYLDLLQPPLHMHNMSYRWSGAYSHAQRDLAADDLLAWTAAQQLDRPDYFAHSHGATVANLATQKGQDFARLVLLSLPVHDEWLPDLNRVARVVDVRVNFDLAILADRGGQRLPRALRRHPKVTEVRNGWFDHSASHEPAYWQNHGIPARL